MDDELERRWDDAVEAAWREFRSRLADHLASMGDGQVLVVQLPGEADGVAPYCQVLRDGSDLRVEAASNEHLAAHARLTAAAEELLVGIGFAAPSRAGDDACEPHWADGGSANFWVDVPRRQADRGAAMVVRALREAYGALHPVYLDAGGLQPGVRRLPVDPALVPRDSAAGPDGGGSSEDAAAGAAGRAREVVFADSAEDLRDAVAAALVPLLGEEPTRDDDGDLLVPTARGVIWVTVAEKAPRLLVHAILVCDVVDEARALAELNLLNRLEFGVTFLMLEGDLAVRREMAAGALLPRELRTEVERIRENLDRWATELVSRVGGRRYLEDGPARPPVGAAVPGAATPGSAAEPGSAGSPAGRPATAAGPRQASRPREDPRLAEAMRVLRELEADERDSVDPAAMLRIFHGDRGLLLGAIRQTDSRARDVRRRGRAAEAEGRVRLTRLLHAQERYQSGLRTRLRKALRLSVVADRPAKAEQLGLFDEDEARAGGHTGDALPGGHTEDALPGERVERQAE